MNEPVCFYALPATTLLFDESCSNHSVGAVKVNIFEALSFLIMQSYHLTLTNAVNLINLKSDIYQFLMTKFDNHYEYQKYISNRQMGF